MKVATERFFLEGGKIITMTIDLQNYSDPVETILSLDLKWFRLFPKKLMDGSAGQIIINEVYLHVT